VAELEQQVRELQQRNAMLETEIADAKVARKELQRRLQTERDAVGEARLEVNELQQQNSELDATAKEHYRVLMQTRQELCEAQRFIAAIWKVTTPCEPEQAIETLKQMGRDEVKQQIDEVRDVILRVDCVRIEPRENVADWLAQVLQVLVASYDIAKQAPKTIAEIQQQLEATRQALEEIMIGFHGSKEMRQIAKGALAAISATGKNSNT
jgi:chromosome segregation ATPase